MTNSLRISFRNFFLMAMIFLLSIMVRLPLLDRPIGANNENSTAHVLTVLQIWSKSPASVHRFGLIITYPGAVNANMPAPFEAPVWDAAGRGYYVSFPPLSFFLPAVLFALLGLSPTMLNLEIYAILLHLVGAIGIFAISKRLIEKISSSSVTANKWLCDIEPIAAFLAFTFLPVNLWNQANVYFAQTAVVPIWIWSLYFFLLVLGGQNGNAAKSNLAANLGLFVLVTLACLTDWFGYFIGMSIFVASLARPGNNRRPLAIVAVTSCTLALALHLFWFFQIGEIQGVVANLLARFNYWQSGVTNQYGEAPSFASTLLRMVVFSVFGFGTAVLMMGPVLSKTPLQALGAIMRIFNRAGFSIVLLLPVVLDFVIFWKHNAAHDFTLVKITVPLSLSLAILWRNVRNLGFLSSFASNARNIVACSCIFLATSTVLLYYRNVYFEQEKICRYFILDCERGIKIDRWQKMGMFIAHHSLVDEAIFILSTDIYSPKLNTASTYYSQRNYIEIKNRNMAIQFMKVHNISKSAIFDFSQNIYSVEKIKFDIQ